MMWGGVRVGWLLVVPIACVVSVCSCGDDAGAPQPSLDAGSDSTDAAGAVTLEAASLQVIHGESATVGITVRQPVSPRRLRIDIKNTGPGIRATGVDLEPGETTARVVVEVEKTVAQGPVRAVSIEASAGDSSQVLATTPLDLFVRGRSGERDTTFGTNGVWETPDAYLDAPLVTFRSDGGYYFVSGPAYPVHRFDVNGNPVSAFGDNGILAMAAGVSTVSITWNGAHLYAAGMTDSRAISLIRADANGVRDVGYGTEGAYRHPYDANDFLHGAAVASSGEAVVFGVRSSAAMLAYVGSNGLPSAVGGDATTALTLHSFGDPKAVSISERSVFVASGSTAFVFDRTTRKPMIAGGAALGDNLYVMSASADATGRWIIGGGSLFDSNLSIARLSADGTLDRSFGASGIIRTAFPGAGSIERSPSGKIIQMAIVDTGLVGGAQTYRTTIARYDENGVLDTSFNDAGTVVFGDLNPFRCWIQPDNRILIVGKRSVRLWQ